MSVYLLHAAGRYKIGISTNIDKRIAAIQNGCPYPVTLIAKSRPESLVLESARSIESKIHSDLAEFRVVGEWFSLSHSSVVELISKYNLNQVEGIPSSASSPFTQLKSRRNSLKNTIKNKGNKNCSGLACSLLSTITKM
ncbi:GIY-YIG nuclease family protein [Spirosoma gilvum]